MKNGMKLMGRCRQHGGSALGNIILVALFAYAIYVGIQYIPQLIESKSVDSMLTSLETQNQGSRYGSAQEVEQAVKSMLNLNQMDDMIQNIQIRNNGSSVSVEVEYERELNLLFQKKMMAYRKVVDLS